MKALTLIQPWAWAIVHQDKRVENRTWDPRTRGGKLGDSIVIHAGSKFDENAAVHIARMLGVRELPAAAHDKGLVGLARLSGIFEDQLALGFPPEQVRWFHGPYGWVLSDVIALRPIACPGQLGLWEVPEFFIERLEALDQDAAEQMAARYLQAM